MASTHSFDGGFRFGSDGSECWQGFQGPKLTFSGRHQLATGIFSQLPYGKKKVSIKFFVRWETQTTIFGRQFFFYESE